MDTTPLFGLPFPEAAVDPPDGPAQIQALAERLEEVLPYKMNALGGPLVTSSATPADISGASVTVDNGGSIVLWEVFVTATLTPSASGDAKINLVVDGTNVGQIAQANSGAGAVLRYSVPGSTTGDALKGGWIVVTVGSGTKVIKLQGSSSAGSATIAAGLTVRSVH